MAVQYIEEQSPYNALGSLMSVAGLAIPGGGLLAPLGMGLSAATGGMDKQQNTMFEKILGNVMDGNSAGNEWMAPPKWMSWGKKKATTAQGGM